MRVMDTLFISWIDIGFAAFLALSMLIGLWRGFVFELLSLVGWFAAYFAARYGTPWLQPMMPIGEPGSGLNYGVSFACAFLAALVIWSIGARVLRALIRATPLSPIDRLLGAGFGLVRGLVVLVIAVVLVGISPWGKAPMWQQSTAVAWLNVVVHELRPLLMNNGASQLPSA
jgi:membrane protein required for colicin V production